MGVNWIEHKGAKILFSDFKGVTAEEGMFEILHAEVEILRRSAERVPVLVDITGTHVTPQYMDELKRLGKEVRNEKVARTAMLGISGIKQVLMNAYMAFTGEKNMKAFKDQNEALDWLAEGRK